MARRYNTVDGARIRNTPVSEYELDRLRYLRDNPHKAKNPPWYKAAKLPAYRAFIPGQPPVYPARCKASTMITPQVLYIPHFDESTDDYQTELNGYIKSFDNSNHLIPTPIIWVKPTHGNFA